MDPERRYRKRYSEIEVRRGDKRIRFRIGIDRNGVRTGSDKVGASNIQTLHSRDVWSCIEKDTVTTRSNNGARLPARGAMNCFVIQPVDSRGIAWHAGCCSCGMEHTDFCDTACGWTVGKEGGSVECWVPIVEEEVPDKVIEVDLSYMLPKCLEGGRWVSRS